jgi:hypothetical protein
MNEKETPRRSYFGPLLLIAVGVVFLLNNLGVAGEGFWTLILRLWPLILIAMGLDSLLQRQGVAGPTFLIGLGAVFLLSNLGVLVWDVWDTVLRAWPILLIAFGLDIIVGRRSTWGSVLAFVLIVVITVGVFWVTGIGLRAPIATGDLNLSEPIEASTRASIHIDPAVGTLELDAQANEGTLVAGVIPGLEEGDVSQDLQVSGGTAEYALRRVQRGFTYPRIGAARMTWDLSLSREIPIQLDVSMGAGRANLDLVGMTLTALSADMGVGQLTVELPGTGDFDGTIEGAVGQTVIVVPEGVGIRIRTDTGITAVSIPGRYLRQGDTYTSPGYSSAEIKIDLAVSQAIGSLLVREEGN